MEAIHAPHTRSRTGLRRSCRRSATRRTQRLAVLLSTAVFAAACGPEEDGDADAVVVGPVPETEYVDYAPGAEVAALELDAPQTSPFVLRATLPLQPRQYVAPGATSPFVVVDRDGNQAPTQVEVVSRFGNDSDGADVVELLARVEVPTGAAPGERIRYTVQLVDHPVGPDLTPLSVVANLMGSPNAFRLRTSDVFGHRYEANLGNDFGTVREKELRDGPLARQTRTHEVMMPVAPVGGNGGTLPHLMGVHAYFTTWAGEQFVSLDLRVHNGGSGHDSNDGADDPLGDLYFEDLELVLPQGWTVLTAFDNPYLGQPYTDGTRRVWPIVEPMADGSLHFMPSQAQFHRRMVLCAPGAEDAGRAYLEEQTLAFCRPGENTDGEPYLSWWNPASARYFPQKMPLPMLDQIGEENLRGDLEVDLADRMDVVRLGTTGTYPMNSPVLGWAHPIGVRHGGGHGGSEIHLYDGVRTAYAGASAGYRRMQLVHRMRTDRHPTALFHADGAPAAVEDWTMNGPNGPYLNAWVWLTPVLFLGDPFGYGSTPDFQRQAVAAQGLAPDYEEDLANYEHNDTEHLVRYTRAPKTLVWLGNDALAKDDLIAQGELCRMTYTPLSNDEFGGMIVTGMATDLDYVARHPGQGVAINRSEGWMIDCIVATYDVADPTLRARIRPWFDDVVDLVETAQGPCTNMFQARPHNNTFDAQYRTRQSISTAILENALWGLLQSVYAGENEAHADRLRTVLEKSAYAMISDRVWNDAEQAPYFQLAVGPHDVEQPHFCGWVPPDGADGYDEYQCWSTLAYGYLLTGDTAFLAKAELMAGGPVQSLQTRVTGYVENSVALLSLDQLLEE